MPKDTLYYDAESVRYSRKRYPAKATTYVQAFYLRRLAIVTEFVRSLAYGQPISVLEVGCADGVILRSLYAALPKMFSSLTGVDVSERMVQTARVESAGLPIRYAVRSGTQEEPRDLVIEVGVLNYVPDFEQELLSLRAAIAPNGHALISLAGKGSLWHRLKRTGDEFADFQNYTDYETVIMKHFSIVAMAPVGLFVPYLWRVPVLARAIQPLAERALVAAPGLFHERIYLLTPSQPS
jgi:2-polyprenyl-3-methyl-5-hydroxy-6-metoxy-1,4-benzoquinol methylase